MRPTLVAFRDKKQRSFTVKFEYVSPTVEVIGSFEEVTQGNATGSSLDADFPTGTPFDDLTFS